MLKEKPNTITLTETNFREEVLESSEPVLVKFWADWCGTCEIMAPIIERLAADYEGQIKFGKLDFDANKRLAREYSVTELPSLLLFMNGQLVDHIIGVVSGKVLEARIRKLLFAKNNLEKQLKLT